MPAVGCSAPLCLLAVLRFRVAVVRRRCVVCAILRRLSARPRPGLGLVVGGPWLAAACRIVVWPCSSPVDRLSMSDFRVAATGGGVDPA
eukprot:1253334-Alexandrium_andersonii.AAC.1